MIAADKHIDLQALGAPGAFAETLVAWQKTFGRRGLPWMVRDPYRRWLSEIMLQQTQVSVVLDYFTRFVGRFPTVEDLAHAEDAEVMALWAGLGYYSRARNLLAAARAVVEAGAFPDTAAELEELPGVGRSTAAAIASFCFDEPRAVLDGNVVRVLSRVLDFHEAVDTGAAKKALWEAAETLVSRTEPGVYNQALMDVGATVCTRTKPKCTVCPLFAFCAAARRGTAEGLPRKSPKRARTQRVVRLARIVRDGKLCVVTRPAGGIWPGLVCLPESEDSGARVLASIRHTLTHRDLTIEICEGADEAPAGCRWIAPGEIDAEGFPAPVRRALLSLV